MIFVIHFSLLYKKYVWKVLLNYASVPVETHQPSINERDESTSKLSQSSLTVLIFKNMAGILFLLQHLF